MCRQAKKMKETVKWLGEIKHFCSLQCLMFFCSLQGITGPVRPASKPLPTQGMSTWRYLWIFIPSVASLLISIDDWFPQGQAQRRLQPLKLQLIAHH